MPAKLISIKKPQAASHIYKVPGNLPLTRAGTGLSAGEPVRNWIRYIRLLLLFGLGLHLAACTAVPRVTNPVFTNAELERQASQASQQPLPFHVGVALSRYRDEDEPVYFLISDDLQHTSYSACSSPPCFYDGRNALTDARKDCSDLRLGTKCWLLYLRRNSLAKNIRFKGSISYRLLRGEKSNSPAESHGKIFYLPGFSGWHYRGYNFPPAMTDSKVSPALQALEARGWDVDVLNMMHLDRVYAWRHPEMIAELLQQLVENARKEGYRKVILYGGSRGGAEIIQAVVEGVRPDAIALMEPDWHGPKFNSRGIYNAEHEVRGEEIGDLIAKLPSQRIVFSYFRNSRWYGDIERTEVRQALDSIDAEYLLIATPESLAGHGASWSQRFANVYGGCLHRFFLEEIDSIQDCKPSQVDESLYENWAVKSRVVSGQFESMSGEEIRDFFRDKGLCRYRPAEDAIDETSCQVWRGNERTRSFSNEFDILITTNDLLDFKPTEFCRHNGFFSPTYRCNQVFRVEEDLVAIVPEDGDSIYWYKVVGRDFVLKKHLEARYKCGNESKLKPGHCQKI